VTYHYDTQGRQTSAVDALGHEQKKTWTANSDPLMAGDQPGRREATITPPSIATAPLWCAADLQEFRSQVETITAWFAARGWRVEDSDLDVLEFSYDNVCRGRYSPDCRVFGDGDTYLWPLECRIRWTHDVVQVEISTCGVTDGCPAHRRHDHTLDTITDLAGLGAELSRWETHASALDPAGIADCLTFGHCGRSHR
jgi:hypothetical protein